MFNGSANFVDVITFLSNLFKDILFMLDNIIIIGDSTSILDFFIAVSVFAILIAAVFTVVGGRVTDVSSDLSSRFRKSGD